MISIQYHNMKVDFEIDMDAGIVNGKFRNCIVIHSMSENLEDKIIIKDGRIYFGKIVFSICYFTESLDHSFSVLGQFVYFLEEFLKEKYAEDTYEYY